VGRPGGGEKGETLGWGISRQEWWGLSPEKYRTSILWEVKGAGIGNLTEKDGRTKGLRPGGKKSGSVEQREKSLLLREGQERGEGGLKNPPGTDRKRIRNPEYSRTILYGSQKTTITKILKTYGKEVGEELIPPSRETIVKKGP